MPCCLTKVEVLEGVVTALVQVCVLGVECFLLSHGLVLLRCGLLLGGSCYRSIRLGHKGLVCNLRSLLSLDCVSLHAFGILNNLLYHRHDTTRSSTVGIGLEAWWWWRTSRLLFTDSLLDESWRVIESLQDVQGTNE